MERITGQRQHLLWRRVKQGMCVLRRIFFFSLSLTSMSIYCRRLLPPNLLEARSHKTWTVSSCWQASIESVFSR